MRPLPSVMWGAVAAIAWTHVGYPLAVGVAARRRRGAEGTVPSAPGGQGTVPSAPRVTLVIAAHDEERVIGAAVDAALALDYPRERLDVVVALDGCTDRTGEVAAARGARVLDNPRRGKIAAQNAAVRASDAEIVAFCDANACWERDALRRLVAPFAQSDVGYVCGRLRLVDRASGANLEGLYWRLELWLRAQESALGSITAGNGAIYAVRRGAYPMLGPERSHDIALPHRLRRAGLRALYAPDAVAVEPAAPSSAAEWERKVRMQSRSWHEVLRGGMLDPRGVPAGYYVALLSHRLVRYATGILHVVVLASSLVLGARRSRAAAVLVALQAAALMAAAAGRAGRGGRLAQVAWYYLVVTAASLAGLVRMLRAGPQITWTPVAGTR